MNVNSSIRTPRVPVSQAATAARAWLGDGLAGGTPNRPRVTGFNLFNFHYHRYPVATLIKSSCLIWLMCALVWLAGLTAPSLKAGDGTLSGRIIVQDGGKRQPTGRAPVWLYDASQSNLLARLPEPDLGGRSQADWTRIERQYPASLEIGDQYQTVLAKRIAAPVKFRALDEQCRTQFKALNGQTNGPQFAEWQRLATQTRQADQDRWQAADAADDQSEVIFYWFTVNPGLLYAGVPPGAGSQPNGHQREFHATDAGWQTAAAGGPCRRRSAGAGRALFLAAGFGPQLCGNDRGDFDGKNAEVTKTTANLKPALISAMPNSINLAIPHLSRDSRQAYTP